MKQIHVYAEHCALQGQQVPARVIDQIGEDSPDTLKIEVSLEEYKYWLNKRISKFRNNILRVLGVELGHDLESLVEILGVITTKNEKGQHFTQLYPSIAIEMLEARNWVKVNKPIHEKTGLYYNEEHYTIEVTEQGHEALG